LDVTHVELKLEENNKYFWASWEYNQQYDIWSHVDVPRNFRDVPPFFGHVHPVAIFCSKPLELGGEKHVEKTSNLPGLVN
jgi:hypothetical protein